AHAAAVLAAPLHSLRSQHVLTTNLSGAGIVVFRSGLQLGTVVRAAARRRLGVIRRRRRRLRAGMLRRVDRALRIGIRLRRLARHAAVRVVMRTIAGVGARVRRCLLLAAGAGCAVDDGLDRLRVGLRHAQRVGFERLHRARRTRVAARAVAAAAAPAARTAAIVAEAGRLAGAAGAAVTVAARLVGKHFALVDPHLHADAAEGRERLDVRVVDVGPQRVQRNLAVVVALGARDLRAAQTPRDLHLHAARAGLHRAHDRLLHRPAERDALLELVDDVLTDEARVQLRRLDLDDVDLDLLPRQLLEVAADLVDADAALPDDDARLARVDDHARLVRTPLDLDARDRGRTRHASEVLPDCDVLVQPRDVVLFLEPAAVPGAGDADAQPDGMDLLSHVTPWLPRRRRPVLSYGATRPDATSRPGPDAASGS